MLSAWMLYCLIVTALLLAAASLLEQAARRLRLPQRWLWAGAMAASALLPLLARWRPEPTPPAATPVATSGGQALLAVDPGPTFESHSSGVLLALSALEPVLLGAWLGASAVLLLIGALAIMRLRRSAEAWERRTADGRAVLLSESTGPAVVGLFPGSIVLPRWVLEGDARARRLMLAHEEEHLRARDPLLLFCASVLVAILPWNLPLWWQLHRLKLAVEVDCDARVLGDGTELRAYADLLLEVGRRRAGLDRALVALAEPASFLERRIRIMTSGQRRRGWLAAGACLAVSTALVAGACAVEPPASDPGAQPPVTGPAEDPVATEPAEDASPAAVSDAAPAEPEVESPAGEATDQEPRDPSAAAVPEPGFSPRDVEPSIRNASEIARELDAAYPPELRDQGVGGRALLWVYVDVDGGVADARLYESSGHPALDEAALRVIRGARFSPARRGETAVPVWIALPVTFQSDEPRPVANEADDPQPLPDPVQTRPDETEGQALAREPAFTPREIEPRLINPADFTRALERAYPPALKAAGIGGRAVLWVFVDADGRVGNTRVYQSSGEAALDEAALSTMRSARFTPARNRGEAVPVWVAVPVVFSYSQ